MAIAPQIVASPSVDPAMGEHGLFRMRPPTIWNWLSCSAVNTPSVAMSVRRPAVPQTLQRFRSAPFAGGSAVITRTRAAHADSPADWIRNSLRAWTCASNSACVPVQHIGTSSICTRHPLWSVSSQRSSIVPLQSSSLPLPGISACALVATLGMHCPTGVPGTPAQEQLAGAPGQTTTGAIAVWPASQSGSAAPGRAAHSPDASWQQHPLGVVNTVSSATPSQSSSSPLPGISTVAPPSTHWVAWRPIANADSLSTSTDVLPWNTAGGVLPGALKTVRVPLKNSPSVPPMATSATSSPSRSPAAMSKPRSKLGPPLAGKKVTGGRDGCVKI